MPGVSEKYVLQRFAHFVYNQNNGSFEHIDCAVRIFNRDEYDKLYEEETLEEKLGRGSSYSKFLAV